MQLLHYSVYKGKNPEQEKPEDVVQEIKRLAKEGIKEVVLTGIHLSSYGKDWGEENGLLHLIEKIHDNDGIERIRLGSLEPRIITDEFTERFGKAG